MTKMTATYFEDGEPVEPETLRCWELVADAAKSAADALEMPLGLVPDATRKLYVDAERACQKLRSVTHGILVQTENYARAGREDALEAAIDDAAFQGKVKGAIRA